MDKEHDLLTYAVQDVEAALMKAEIEVGTAEAVRKVLDALATATVKQVDAEKRVAELEKFQQLCDFYRGQIQAIIMVLRSQP